MSLWGEVKKGYLKAFAVYAVAMAVVSVLLYLDLRPEPIYRQLEPVPERKLEAFEEGEPVSVEFDSPGKGINRIYWANLLPISIQEVRVTLENLTTGETVTSQVTCRGEERFPITRFPSGNAAGDRMRLTLQWLREEPPAVHAATEPPRVPVSVSQNGQALDFVPRFYLGKKVPKTPEPVEELAFFSTLEPVPADRAVALDAEHPLEIRFAAPEADLDYVWIPRLLTDVKNHVRVEVINEATGVLVKKSVARDGDEYQRHFEGQNAAGDPMLIRLTWLATPPPVLQCIHPQERSRFSLSVTAGGAQEDFEPLFQLGYDWPTFWLLWLWLPVGAGVFWTLRRPRFEPWLLVLLGLCGLVTSVLAWQQAYSHLYLHYDPDRYGLYAQSLAAWFTGGEDQQALKDFFHSYPHTHLPLTPLLVAVPIMLGLPTELAYILVAALASFGTLAALHFICRRLLRLSSAVTVVTLVLAAVHLSLLKAYARPSTDAVGLFLVVLTLGALISRFQHKTSSNSFILSALIILSALARPPGLTYIAYIGSVALLCDWIRDRKFQPVYHLVEGMKIGLPPLVVLGALYLGFDWSHNMALAIAKSKEFHDYARLDSFLIDVAMLAQAMVLSWVFLFKAKEKWPVTGILALWAVFYLAVLVVAKAPFLHRLFLPVLPAAVLLTALSLERMGRYTFAAFAALFLIVAGLNLWAVIYDAGLPHLPPAPLSRFIY